MQQIPMIEMSGITKVFPGVIANKDVNLNISAGEIHALLGENGAGKSTLMSILAGLYRPDTGTIKIKGQPVKLRSPRIALEMGIGMIYQHFRLINNFTVAENIVLGANAKNIRYNRAQIEIETLNLAEKFKLEITPSSRVRQLSIGEQQRVEILKMLYRGCDVLIMDEPTTVLTPAEVRELFVILRSMAEEGKAIIVITHKLNEVLEIADRVTVLRKGEVVGTRNINEVDEKTLTSMMVAHSVEHSQADRQSQPGECVLEVQNLKVKGDTDYLAVDGANLDLRRGEIVCIAGVSGNGQKELIEAIAGLRPVHSGGIKLHDANISMQSVRKRMELGISMIPEDRLGMGLVPNTSIMDNSILRSYYKKDFHKGLFLNYRKIASYAKKLADDFNIFVSDVGHPVNYLSGGNLQKLLLGREISQEPEVLIAAYPVRGLDIAAAEAVYNLILQERARGTAVLLVLEDLDDIFRLADRVAVMYDGGIVGIFPVEQADIDKIGALMLGTEVKKQACLA
ncbi:MAG: ABC transporter ATP-binding protein [Syntrophomonadaceae bacterium]|nr:ABC transporter ATP-binding protein [Syntrophomonadaceae bacterium]MDD3889517.1 ABC transporter ATP-binding protein [Syntrophomonadaceae bacterium]MDD4548769.1 ABC transporter ATP-binding protein [Syntrophomonadaceae bacterium]